MRRDANPARRASSASTRFFNSGRRRKITEAFRTGKGVGWHEHDTCLFCGTERFFRPNYAMNLLSAWIPALTGIEAKLRAGGTVADVGCGHGASTLLMAEAFPQSKFVGFDYHAPSIEQARNAAAERGLKNVDFEVASSKAFPARGGYEQIGRAHV